MPSKRANNRTFDARPDRIDYRDRVYNPPLVCLPEQYPSQKFIESNLADYTRKHKLILNQGQEGACTGFGLAAVINYLLWKKHLEEEAAGGNVAAKMVRVSSRMLYQMARIYDEWPGEDYEGSSCRGAMKGWYRHGICTEQLWPYKTKFVSPKIGWQQDAARRPLGAYYRINKDSIADMQAAIREVGAIYVSATVHKGWFLDASERLQVIPFVAEEAGGHAFAITGYTSQGFIVQNSWGEGWGFLGFAILGYEDWIRNGSDAWVAVCGAPMEIRDPQRTCSSLSLHDAASGRAEWSWSSGSTTPSYIYANPAAQPLSEGKAYEHTLVLGNDGQPINRFLDVENAADAVREAAFTLPLPWLERQQSPTLAIYAHGGLNNEEASLKRIRIMAPYFIANGIYPLFLTWKTGFGESIAGILDDAITKFFKTDPDMPSRGLWSDVRNRLKEAKDRSVELACENLLVKPVWMQMKQNATAATERNAGLTLLAGHLTELKKRIPALQIHLVGHSAGSILHGHLLDQLVLKKIPVASLSLYAPACTVGFALEHYVPAINKGVLPKERLFLDIMSDERERADTVGPYGKSLLYLVSRALEEVHKMPLLGMEAVWNPATEGEDQWNSLKKDDVATWRAFMGGTNGVSVYGNEYSKIFDGQEHIPLAHGSFDNNVKVVSGTLKRIRGADLAVEVENLHGF